MYNHLLRVIIITQSGIDSYDSLAQQYHVNLMEFPAELYFEKRPVSMPNWDDFVL